MSDQPQQEGETVELKKSMAQLKQGLVSMAAIFFKADGRGSLPRRTNHYP